MNGKPGPTSTFVGPASLGQPDRETQRRVLQPCSTTLRRSCLNSAILAALLCLFIAPSGIQRAGAADPYATDSELSPPELNYYVRERNQRAAAEQQEHFRKRVEIKDAVGDDVLAAYVKKQRARIQTPSASPLPPISGRTLLYMAICFVTSVLVVRKLAPELLDSFNKTFNPWLQTEATIANLSAKVRAEDEAFSEFVAAFRTGPSTVAGNAGSSADASNERGLLTEFYAKAPKTLATLQKLLQEIGQAGKGVVRQRMLGDVYRELRDWKNSPGLPELLPAWQMTLALEGLVKQLTDKASEVNPSTLRTVAGGVELLKDLCAPGLDLLTNPPFRLLAVDDDPISRNAVSFALKKAFNPPDLAENGEAALALVTEHAYDVIFLDVQMPGMDGFEVCTRIHDTITNCATPVVFVTCQSDFEARAQSTLSGGNDLIGKPFLTFEITVKALTLALRSRLDKRAAAPESVAGRRANPAVSPKAGHAAALTQVPAFGPRPGDSPAGNRTAVTTSGTDAAAFTKRASAAPTATTDPTSSSGELSPKQLLNAFMARASTNLGPLRDLIQTTFRVTDENMRQEMLADFFLRFNALAPKADAAAEEHPALRLCAALEGLLTKMLGNPRQCTSSTLLTVATGVDLLIDLCDPEVRPDLVTEPPIRLLVVDDDPVARRAITGALQVAFEKPDAVDSGEAALVSATEKHFDAIFLDVEMPGMDGFAVCLKIRETEQNRATPIVFVTGHSDFKSRSQSVISGGNDLIAKPFLPAEIKVKALTFVLRGRLQKSKIAQNGLLLPREEESKQAELVPA
jgi:CheY-like chemotaxis protein